jgi:ferredoxin
MAWVTVTPHEGDAVSMHAPLGGALGDLCDDACAPVPFSCRSATCATCRIEVLEGEAELLPAEADEVALLSIFASRSVAGHPMRLACQAKVRPGEGRLVVRAVADDEP